MTIQFNDETFRDDYRFRDSEWAIKRFPFPFHEDSYMYSVNMERHRGGPDGSVYAKPFDVDEHYISEMRDRALVLSDDALHCQSLPHIPLAGWDLLELIMVSKSEDYPELFELHRDGRTWRWVNKSLGIDDTCTFMDEASLSHDPIDYITRRAIARCWTSARTTCGWMRAWSRHRPTGRWHMKWACSNAR